MIICLEVSKSLAKGKIRSEKCEYTQQELHIFSFFSKIRTICTYHCIDYNTYPYREYTELSESVITIQKLQKLIKSHPKIYPAYHHNTQQELSIFWFFDLEILDHLYSSPY